MFLWIIRSVDRQCKFEILFPPVKEIILTATSTLKGLLGKHEFLNFLIYLVVSSPNIFFPSGFMLLTVF